MQRKFDFARDLRKRMTPTERRVWGWLRDRRFQHAKFRRQYPIGPYVLDFYAPSLKLAIELDGRVHATDDQALHDRQRDRYLTEQLGIAILRLYNETVRKHPDGAGDAIADAIAMRRR